MFYPFDFTYSPFPPVNQKQSPQTGSRHNNTYIISKVSWSMTPRFQDAFTSSFLFVSAHPRCWGQHLCCQSSSKEAPDIICKTAHHGGDGLMDVTNKQIICHFSIETLFQWDKARQPPPKEKWFFQQVYYDFLLSTHIITYYIATISLQNNENLWLKICTTKIFSFSKSITSTRSTQEGKLSWHWKKTASLRCMSY